MKKQIPQARAIMNIVKIAEKTPSSHYIYLFKGDQRNTPFDRLRNQRSSEKVGTNTKTEANSSNYKNRWSLKVKNQCSPAKQPFKEIAAMQECQEKFGQFRMSSGRNSLNNQILTKQIDLQLKKFKRKRKIEVSLDKNQCKHSKETYSKDRFIRPILSKDSKYTESMCKSKSLKKTKLSIIGQSAVKQTNFRNKQKQLQNKQNKLNQTNVIGSKNHKNSQSEVQSQKQYCKNQFQKLAKIRVASPRKIRVGQPFDNIIQSFKEIKKKIKLTRKNK